ncbi:TPA: RAQPRD family integrative conjugative element protein [Salmonella enterica]|uniref:integrative conjugative element protein, RAQPRD family n=1 Tax=Salmonella enterica TaxID=28901 RepID=UPI0002E17E6B|nr:RAQPRD family integrative conjugative element protein [Salmonella enterica]
MANQHTPVYIYPLLIIFCILPLTSVSAPLTEREELTLSLNQLSQIEASLHRAQQSARTGINERYYFDYPRIHNDITTLRSGIEHYLTPARAQPRDTATLVGQYRGEKNAP